MSGSVSGVICYYSQGAAAALIGNTVTAAQETRFTREKHDPGFSANTIKLFLASGASACGVPITSSP